MSAQPTAGTRIYISASLPASNDLASFSALSWTQIRGVRVAGELGNTWSTREDNLIDVDFVVRRKANLMFNTTPLEVVTISGDPGQALLLAASSVENSYAFRIMRKGGGERYFVAQVVSFIESQGSKSKPLFDAVASLEQQAPVVFN